MSSFFASERPGSYGLQFTDPSSEDDDEEEEYEEKSCSSACCDVDCECDDCLRCAEEPQQHDNGIEEYAAAA